MVHELKNEPAVVAAVRRFLEAEPVGGGPQEAMASLISETSCIGLCNLDTWERILRAELWKSEGDKSSTSWTFWKKPAIKAPSFASWIDLCHSNGFKRERALRSSLGGAPNSFFLAIAVRRLNDWVPEVRAAAEERLPEVAALSSPRAVVDVLWSTLPHWTSWGRLGDAAKEVLLNIASMEAVSHALVSHLKEATTGPAAAILAQLGRTGVIDQWLGDIASGATQPSVRAKAYRCLLERRITWVAGYKWTWTDKKWCKGRVYPIIGDRPIDSVVPLQATLKAALLDPSPLVRRVAADQLMLHQDDFGPELAVLADALAADPSQYVAERGRFILSRGTHAS